MMRQPAVEAIKGWGPPPLCSHPRGQRAGEIVVNMLIAGHADGISHSKKRAFQMIRVHTHKRYAHRLKGLLWQRVK